MVQTLEIDMATRAPGGTTATSLLPPLATRMVLQVRSQYQRFAVEIDHYGRGQHPS